MGGPQIADEVRRPHSEDEPRRSADSDRRIGDAGHSRQARHAQLDRALLGFFVLSFAIGVMLFLVDLLTR